MTHTLPVSKIRTRTNARNSATPPRVENKTIRIDKNVIQFVINFILFVCLGYASEPLITGYLKIDQWIE